MSPMSVCCLVEWPVSSLTGWMDGSSVCQNSIKGQRRVTLPALLSWHVLALMLFYKRKWWVIKFYRQSKYLISYFLALSHFCLLCWTFSWRKNFSLSPCKEIILCFNRQTEEQFNTIQHRFSSFYFRFNNLAFLVELP